MHGNQAHQANHGDVVNRWDYCFSYDQSLPPQIAYRGSSSYHVVDGDHVTCGSPDCLQGRATMMVVGMPKFSATPNWNWPNIRLLPVLLPAMKAPKAPMAGAKKG